MSWAHDRLRASVEARVEQASADRAGLLIAAARYLHGKVLVDGHLAGSEVHQIRRALAGDFVDDEIEWILEALVELPRELLALGASEWVHPLYRAYAHDLPSGRNETERAQHVEAALDLRWPMHVDPRRPIETQHIATTRDGIQIGSPSSIRSLFVRWRDVESIEPVEPWPQILIEWREGAHFLRARIGPSKDPEAFDASVEALFDAAEARLLSSKLPTGWLATPRAEWEDVDELPHIDERPEPASYRSAPVSDPIVAVRAPRGGLGTMLEWLASSPTRPFRSMVRRAVLTESYLYVERRDGRAQRIPIGLLAAAEGGDDAVYRFGRGTTLVLGGRRECAVCRALDARLASPAALE